ncbi:MAG: hypothetical protein GYA57_08435 [Myxococcales bacterium]|nr:hypothetical protein [Myxococcales bacterium]
MTRMRILADACTTGACGGAPVTCDDGDPCTADVCSPAAGGCVFAPHPVWYPDRDGDGWGTGSDGVCGATAPPATAARTGDCCDANPFVHPEQPSFFDAPYACAAGDPPTWDYDCDGSTTLEHPDLADFCPSTRDAGGSCWSVAVGWCPATAGPDCGFVPACGERGIFQANCEPEFSWSACDDAVEPPPLDAGTPSTDGGSPPTDGGAGPAIDAGGGPGDALDARTKESVAIHCCRPTYEIRTQACR